MAQLKVKLISILFCFSLMICNTKGQGQDGQKEELDQEPDIDPDIIDVDPLPTVPSPTKQKTYTTLQIDFCQTDDPILKPPCSDPNSTCKSSKTGKICECNEKYAYNSKVDKCEVYLTEDQVCGDIKSENYKCDKTLYQKCVPVKNPENAKHHNYYFKDDYVCQSMCDKPTQKALNRSSESCLTFIQTCSYIYELDEIDCEVSKIFIITIISTAISIFLFIIICIICLIRNIKKRHAGGDYQHGDEEDEEEYDTLRRIRSGKNLASGNKPVQTNSESAPSSSDANVRVGNNDEEKQEILMKNLDEEDWS